MVYIVPCASAAEDPATVNAAAINNLRNVCFFMPGGFNYLQFRKKKCINKNLFVAHFLLLWFLVSLTVSKSNDCKYLLSKNTCSRYVLRLHSTLLQ
jgi:hypothetical protein